MYVLYFLPVLFMRLAVSWTKVAFFLTLVLVRYLVVE